MPNGTADSITEIFSAAYRQHRDAIARLCASILRDPAEAEDATQEAFARAWRFLEAGGEGDLYPWLRTVARNHCYDLLRRRRHAAVADHETLELAAPLVAGGEDAVVQHERAVFARASVRRLSAADQQILELREERELSYREIAASAGIPMASVESRLYRARRALRREYLALVGPDGMLAGIWFRFRLRWQGLHTAIGPATAAVTEKAVPVNPIPISGIGNALAVGAVAAAAVLAPMHLLASNPTVPTTPKRSTTAGHPAPVAATITIARATASAADTAHVAVPSRVPSAHHRRRHAPAPAPSDATTSSPVSDVATAPTTVTTTSSSSTVPTQGATTPASTSSSTTENAPTAGSGNGATSSGGGSTATTPTSPTSPASGTVVATPPPATTTASDPKTKSTTTPTSTTSTTTPPSGRSDRATWWQPVQLEQTGATSATAASASGYYGTLSVEGASGTVAYDETTGWPLVVTSSGVVELSAATPAGTYVASGTDDDSVGDSGSWSFTVVVTAPYNSWNSWNSPGAGSNPNWYSGPSSNSPSYQDGESAQSAQVSESSWNGAPQQNGSGPSSWNSSNQAAPSTWNASNQAAPSTQSSWSSSNQAAPSTQSSWNSSNQQNSGGGGSGWQQGGNSNWGAAGSGWRR